MDENTLENLAEFICGGEPYPVYRTGAELTRFFRRAGLRHAVHDGSTRKWWTLEVLRTCSPMQLRQIIERLASPLEYGGDRETIKSALNSLNKILSVEGLRVKLEGKAPIFEPIEVDFTIEDMGGKEEDLKPLPPPAFLSLRLEPGIGDLLQERCDEVQKCMDSGAYLAATVMMGSLLEGLLLGVFQRNPTVANQAVNTPVDSKTGKPKNFSNWKLSEMIDIAHSLGWIDLDVKKFSHALREFRNLIHPHSQRFYLYWAY